MPAHRQRSQRSRRARPAGIAAVLAMAAGTGLFAWNAQAGTLPATATVSDGKVYYTAAEGQTNDVTITLDDSSGDGMVYTIDDSVEITPGTGCTNPSSSDLTYVRCTTHYPGDGASDLTTLIADLGDGDDTGRVATSHPETDVILGGPGDDKLTGTGNCDLEGGKGDDEISGAEYAMGNSGNDTVTNSFSVHAGPGHDVVEGSDDGDHIDGGPGNDKLIGGAGKDLITGGKGDDYIEGGTYADTLYGNSGEDTILGGTGDDKLYGGADADELHGDQGNDLLHGGSGKDALDGGSGTDSLHKV
ncbi:MAG: hypothetical protein QOF44_3097 [Streptomyces sp.]|nr:hypothetical protein [Streptomyces sp.]